ncbi:MAG: phosphoenolpyruvate--protein phosphotransferase, partial [Chloroflexi bacterium]
VENNFGEDDTTAEPAATAPPPAQAAEAKAGELVGVAASPGIAIGPAFLYRAAVIKVETRQIDDPQAEQDRLRQAIEAAKQEIDLLKRQAESQISRYEAGIFEAHRLVLKDPALVDAALGFIAEAHINAEAAWQKAVEAIIAGYQALDDPYLQARQADVTDVGQRVLKHLTGTVPAKPTLDTPSIIIADDLSPSDTMQLDPDKVLGICTALGSATAHSAILARALGIPAVVGVGPAIRQIKDGTVVALDGQQGKVWPAPDEQTRRDLQARRDRWRSDWALLKASAQQPAITTDGKRVEIAANIGAATEIKNALRHGAEGVGLFRTELLFINRTAPPDEEEQVAIYRQAADLLGRRPLIIRTLDIGGDKPLPYLNLPPEENPFLGWRGIRLCLGQPELFKTQLRAILRASFKRQIKIMFPMVSTVDEIRAARQLLAEVQADLRASGIPFDEGMQIGIMVETPAAVAQADLLATEVDFFSIGTNDLSQYTMAADRTNARVSALTNPFHPAVLRMIQQTIKAGHKAGIWVGMCGEFAGNPLAAPLLLGLELDEFSMNAPAIPQVKQIIRRLSLRKARQIARKALKLDSAQAVEAFLKTSLPSG